MEKENIAIKAWNGRSDKCQSVLSVLFSYIIVGICVKEDWELSVIRGGVTQHEQRDES